MADPKPLVRLEYPGGSEMVPTRPLGELLRGMNLTHYAARFGVERFTGAGWERFPLHRTPLPGDHLRVKGPPEPDRPHLRNLFARVLSLRFRANEGDR